MGSLEVVELSECTLHLVEYAANRGLARIPQMPRIKGSVLRYLPFFVLMGVGGWLRGRDREIAPTEDSHKEVAIGRSLLQKRG